MKILLFEKMVVFGCFQLYVKTLYGAFAIEYRLDLNETKTGSLQMLLDCGSHVKIWTTASDEARNCYYSNFQCYLLLSSLRDSFEATIGLFSMQVKRLDVKTCEDANDVFVCGFTINRYWDIVVLVKHFRLGWGIGFVQQAITFDPVAGS